MIYDTIIIGGGASALTGALYLGRYERNVLVVCDSVGGQTAIAGVIENFPGYASINGAELMLKLKTQVENLETVEIKEGASVSSVNENKDGFEVKSGDNIYQGKTILIAAGKRHRKLGLDNEDSLVGRGISYCATCDGPFARGKKAAVIGGGNSAVEAAQILSKVAQSVYVINISDRFNAETTRVKQIESDPKVEILQNTKLTELVADSGKLSQIKIKDAKGKESTKECQMVFVEIGWEPNTEEFGKFVELNEAKEIKIDKNDNKTSRVKVYAAGDITDISAKQVIVACGEGAKAAIAINKYLGSSGG